MESMGIAGKLRRRETRWRRWYEFGCESFEHWLSEVRGFVYRRNRGKGSPMVRCWEPVFGQEGRSWRGSCLCSPSNGGSRAGDSGEGVEASVVVDHCHKDKAWFPRERAAAKGWWKGICGLSAHCSMQPPNSALGDLGRSLVTGYYGRLPASQRGMFNGRRQIDLLGCGNAREASDERYPIDDVTLLRSPGERCSATTLQTSHCSLRCEGI